MFKVEAFVRWGRTKRFLLISRHGRFRGRRDGDYVPLPYLPAAHWQSPR